MSLDRLAVLTAGYIARGFTEEMAIGAAREMAERLGEREASDWCNAAWCEIGPPHPVHAPPAPSPGQAGAEKCVRCGEPGSIDGAFDAPGQPSCEKCYCEWGPSRRSDKWGFAAWSAANPIAPAAPAPAAAEVAPHLRAMADEQLAHLADYEELKRLAALGRLALEWQTNATAKTSVRLTSACAEYLAAREKGE